LVREDGGSHCGGSFLRTSLLSAIMAKDNINTDASIIVRM
jgi:hypothetical protein